MGRLDRPFFLRHSVSQMGKNVREEGGMLRTARVASAILITAIAGARAETPLERGNYLVNTIMTCGNCHTPKGPNGPIEEMAFSGGLRFDEPPFDVTASNITPDRETGIGIWSDAELKKALTTGMRPNGVPLAPVMPTGYYSILTSTDLDAIVAYLRSLKPIKNKVPDPIYKIAVPRQVFPGSERPIDPAALNEKVQRGFYLATIGHCMECHTPFGSQGVDFNNALGKGGREFPGPWGVSRSRNITASKQHGVGAWSDAEIKRAITQGVSRDRSKLKPPMGYAYYARMTESDLDALTAWLRTVPPRD
jgi:mono/diheme cytochrome c family protein